MNNLRGSALLVIDVQNDFCRNGSLEVKDGDAVVPVINRIAGVFSIVVATQDWHPADHLSFASNHSGKKINDIIDLGGVSQVLWPDHCVQGTEGADFHKDLDTALFSLILRKGRNRSLDSYSAFFENDKKTKTGLNGYLREMGIENLYLTGLATDYCVYYSAMDAIALGFNVFIVEDAVRGVDFPRGNIEKAVSEMKKSGVNFIGSDDLPD